MDQLRYWVYDKEFLMRRFARLEEATYFAGLRGFQIVVKPRPKKKVDLSQFAEAPF